MSTSTTFFEDDLKLVCSDFGIINHDKNRFEIKNNNGNINMKNWNGGGQGCCLGNKIIIIGKGNELNNKNKIIKEITWTIEINNINDGVNSGNILIGIVEESEWNCYSCNGVTWRKNCYAFGCNGGRLFNNNSTKEWAKGVRGAKSIVEMKLNVENKTLSYKVDNNDYGIAFDNIADGNYRFGIEMNRKDDEVTILKEYIIKYNDNAVIMNINNKIKEWSLDLQLLCENINLEMKNIKIDANQIEQTRKDLNEMKLKEEEYEQSLLLLRLKIKEYERAIEETLNPSVLNYKEWKSINIINWIMSLDNGIYKEYCDDIKKSFDERDIKGEDLQYINKDDMFKYGVKKFGHCVQLCKHFDSLINQQTN